MTASLNNLGFRKLDLRPFTAIGKIGIEKAKDYAGFFLKKPALTKLAWIIGTNGNLNYIAALDGLIQHAQQFLIITPIAETTYAMHLNENSHPKLLRWLQFQYVRVATGQG